MPVDPVRGIGVSANLQVFAQLLVTDRAALAQEQLDLLEHQRIALDRGGMVSLLKPDPPPDPFCLLRRRQASEPLPQLSDLDLKPLVDIFP